uniref:Replication factor A C-terminal domain-containing protein n=1 Tax=Daucus carota subsp. sativus TaxID=79200 RepID=A0A161ZZV1_DAUCS
MEQRSKPPAVDGLWDGRRSETFISDTSLQSGLSDISNHSRLASRQNSASQLFDDRLLSHSRAKPGRRLKSQSIARSGEVTTGQLTSNETGDVQVSCKKRKLKRKGGFLAGEVNKKLASGQKKPDMSEKDFPGYEDIENSIIVGHDCVDESMFSDEEFEDDEYWQHAQNLNSRYNKNFAKAQKYENKIVVGNIHVLSNFFVKDYKPDEKFRCVCCEKQIYFTNFTEVEVIPDDDTMIPRNVFDFADLGDLIDIADDNTYLTAQKYENKIVVGNIHVLSNFFVKDYKPDEKFRCVCCEKQIYFTNFTEVEVIPDDDTMIPRNVFDFADLGDLIDIADDNTYLTEKADISNVTATTFYLNYDHHSVNELRRMLNSPLFSKVDFSSQMPPVFEEHEISSVKALGLEYLDIEVICEIKIILIVQMDWYKAECSSCYRKIEIVDGEYRCIICNRDLPFADKKFHIMAEAIDQNDSMTIALNDQTVRKLIGKTGCTNEKVPSIINTLESKWYSAKVKISSHNIDRSISFFYVTDMFEIKGGSSSSTSQTSVRLEEMSSSSIHLDGLEDLSFNSPEAGRIHAFIARPHIFQLQNLIREGETYEINNFVVRRYTVHSNRCFRNDIYFQLNQMTEVLLIGGVEHIPPNVFEFIDLSDVMVAANRNEYLIDVVGILDQLQPISTFTNRRNQQQPCIRFTIKDMQTRTEVTFYDEMAESFDQAVNDAFQHPFIIIISSCKAQSFRAFIEIHNFANLEITDKKCDWKIQAMVSRRWNQVNRNTGEVFGINLLLVDEFVYIV